MTSGDREQGRSKDTLTYQGRTWNVESEPVVIDSADGAELVEVWVRRGEGHEQPIES
ncbi:hypothetical protein ABZ352_35585 [Streptomyces griseofuscus]|uniref:hypothetical protein n=1 Tax=Streptomyces griseofuscus TaxID=146922 RepID=UPI003410B0DA